MTNIRAAIPVIALVAALGLSNSTFGAGADNLINATALPAGVPISDSGNTATLPATKEAGEPNHGFNAGGKSVWWSWQPNFSGSVIISTVGGTGFDTIMSVYQGPAPGSQNFGNITSIGENDDSAGGLQSTIVVNVSSGNTYYIAVDGYNGASGAYTLTLKTNDAFANRIALPNVLPVIFPGNNSNASGEGGSGEPAHAGNGGPYQSVWYTFTPASSGKITISAQNQSSSIYPVLSIYTGSAVNSLTLVAQSDCNTNTGTLSASATFIANGGTTYDICVDTKYNGNDGSFTLNVDNANPPANDDLINATVLSGSLPITVNGSNVQASRESGENVPFGAPPIGIGSASVWWKWTSNVTGKVTVSTEGSNFDTFVGVYSGGPGFPLGAAASNDDFGASTFSQVSFSATNGTTYFFGVDGKNGLTGNIHLLLTQPPANDDLANATNITGLPVTVTGTNRFASKEGGEPNILGIGGGASVWWRWKAPSTGRVTFSTAGSAQGLDTLLAVYDDGNTFPRAVQGQNDDSSPFVSTSQVTLSVTANTFYCIAVEGKNGQMGLIQLNIVPAVQNDDIANAITLSGALPITRTDSNDFASREPNEPNHGGANGGASIWYKWTNGVTPQKVVFSTQGSAVATGVGVYTWNGIPSAFPINSGGNTATLITQGGYFANNQNFSQVSWGAAANTTYYIAVDSQYVQTGSIKVTLTNPPANDDLTGAITITGTLPAAVTTGTNRYATNQVSEPDHDENNNVPATSSVWWSWTAPSDATATFSTAGSDFNTVLAVYTGTAVNNLIPVGKNNDFGISSTSQVTVSVHNGNTYLIAVDGYYGAQGSITLNIQNTPANDNFSAATDLGSALPASDTGSNLYASKESGEPDHAANNGFPKGGASVWWKWTAPSTTKVDVSTSGSNFDTLLAVYTGSAVNALTFVAANDDFNGVKTSQLTFQAISGTVYMIAVDGRFGASGNISLALDPASAPANDDFANAAAINGSLPVTVTGSNVDASKEAGEPIHDPNNFDAGGTSVWWSWTAPSTEAVTVSTSGSTFSTLLGIYIGNAVSTLTAVTKTNQGQLTFNASAGTTYMIVVDGSGGSAGDIQLTLATPPANDNFNNATVLSSTLPVNISDSNVGATKEGGEPYHGGTTLFNGNFGGASVWYSWQSTNTETVTITTFGSDFDTLLGVYTGNTVGSLTYVAGNDNAIETSSSVTFDATAGTTYHIAVDGYNSNSTGAKTGNINLTIKSYVLPDLLIQSISHLPTNPTPGQTVTFTVTVQNPTSADVGLHAISFYQNLASAPDFNSTTTSIQQLTVVGANSTATLDFSISAPAVGTYTAWAYADIFDNISEADEGNNAGPNNGHSWTVVPLPPSVTSSLTASATVGSAFTYTITGSNNPTSFNATGLPAGLSVNASGAITGTPTATGTKSVTISATNAGGTGSATLNITVNPAPPVITSALSATGVQDTQFNYSITATGTDPIVYGASGLPAGLSLSGTTITGSPTVFGTFVVTLTATNGAGSDTKQLTLNIGNKTDQDNDGFSDEIEAALGTDPTSAASTPFTGNAPAGTPDTLSISSFKLALNASAGGNDSIGVSGFFISSSTSFDGKTIVLDVGGVVKKFTLNAKGQSPKANETIKVTTKNGAINFAAKLSKGTYASSFEDEGLTGTNSTSGIKKIVINVLWADKMYTKDQFLSAASKSGKVGGSGLGLDKSGGTIQGR